MIILKSYKKGDLVYKLRGNQRVLFTTLLGHLSQYPLDEVWTYRLYNGGPLFHGLKSRLYYSKDNKSSFKCKAYYYNY